MDRRRSTDVTEGAERAPARAMLRAVGFTDEDFGRPQVGVASSWNEVTPCNVHLNRMAAARLDLPSVFLYGGTIMPGLFQGRDVTIQDVFEAVGATAAGSMTPEEL